MLVLLISRIGEEMIRLVGFCYGNFKVGFVLCYYVLGF